MPKPLSEPGPCETVDHGDMLQQNLFAESKWELVRAACNSQHFKVTGKESSDRRMVHFVNAAGPVRSVAGTGGIEWKIEIHEDIVCPVENLCLGHPG